MLKRISTALLLGVLAFAAPAAEIEDLLPESTPLLIKLSDWTGTRAAIKETALGGILAEEDVQEYLKGVEGVLDKILAALEKETGIRKDDFRAAYGTEIAGVFLGLGEFTAEEKAELLVKVRRDRLRWVGLGCQLWADDNDENFPPNLKDLIPLYIDQEEDLLGPGYEEHAADGIDYGYVAGLKITDEMGNVLAYEPVPDKDGKVVVGFIDAHTELMAHARLKKLLTEQKDKYAKAGRALAAVEPEGMKLGDAAALAGELRAEEMPAMAFGFLARVGDEEAAGRVSVTIQKLIVEEGRIKPEPFAWGPVKGTRMKVENEMHLYAFRAGAWQAWLFAVGEGQVKGLAAALTAGKNARPLSGAGDFQLCRARLAGRVDALAYVGIKKGLDQLEDHLPAEPREIFNAVVGALRARDISAMLSTIAVEPPGFRTRSFTACKLGEEGLPGLLAAEPLPAGLLKFVPASAVVLNALGWHPERILPAVRKVIGAVDPDAVGEMDGNLAELKEQLGFDIEKDILGALGTHGCVYVLPAAEAGGNPMLGQINGLTLVLEVRDAEALRRAVGRLTELAKAAMGARFGGPGAGGGGEGEMITEFEYRGQKVVSINVGGMAAPGFAVTDKYLLLAGNVQMVKKAIARLSDPAKAGPGLVDSEGFKKAFERVKLEEACALTYNDTASNIPAAMAQMGVVGAVMVPMMGAMGGNRDLARSAAGKANLRIIGLGCQLWADEHDEVFPPDLKAMVPLYLDDPKIFLCPGYAEHAADGIDYAYVAGLHFAVDGRTPLAYETLPDARGRVNVLFVDGHVESMTPDGLKKQMEEWHAKSGCKIKIAEPAGVARGGGGGEDVIDEMTFIELLKQLTNPATMPPADSITRHLFPAVSTSRRVEGGILTEGFSPLGFGGGGDPAKAVAVVGIGLGLLLPAVANVRESARRASCKSNLRQIGLGCHLWADENDDKFPPDFKALVPTYIDNPAVFKCPSGMASYGDFNTGKVTRNSSSYVYIKGLDAAVPGMFFLAYGKPQNHRGAGINVLFTDAHVEWRRAGPQFEIELAAQKQALEEWRKGGRAGNLIEIYDRILAGGPAGPADDEETF